MKEHFIQKKRIWIFLFPIVWILVSTEIISAQGTNPLPQNDQCIICHKEKGLLPQDFKKSDIHMQEGLSCVGCHGGNSKATKRFDAESKANGFVGVPAPKDIPKFCGKCHSNIQIMRKFQPRIATDQVKQYYTSVHGKRLEKGDKKVAICSSCHSAHAILPASDSRSTTYSENVPGTCKKCHADAKYMSPYSIGTSQYEEFKKSVHGIALLEKHDTGAPACNDCHGNHGAIPPGESSISHICGSCHVQNMEYFVNSEMGKDFVDEDLHDCEECHDNHLIEKTNDEMVGVGENSLCMGCHDEGDEGYATADSIYFLLTSLKVNYDSAAVMQEKVRRIGLDDVDISFLLKDAHQALIEARTLVHTFETSRVEKKTKAGETLTTKALNLSFVAIKDFRFRRMGFGLATFFITLFAIALFFKIRQNEKNKITKK